MKNNLTIWSHCLQLNFNLSLLSVVVVIGWLIVEEEEQQQQQQWPTF